jgi:DNA helicase-2/ATP-dependent DNA helicase PcrA
MLDGKIPYVIYGGTRFYDRAEVKNMLGYLRMIIHNDDLAFKRIINVPKRGLGDKSMETLFDLAKVKNVTMYEIAKTANPFKGKIRETVEDFVDMVEGWKDKVATTKLTDLFELVANESGLRFLYEENNETDRIENIKELINDIDLFQNQYPEAGLDEYLQMVSLYGERNEVSAGDFVTLMTVHAAKGLEFETVFVVGMSEGIFPNERAMAEGKRGLEEERRLAYVAYTRAKNKLFLSETKGYSFILGSARRMSRFIEEINEKHIDHIGVNYDYDHPKEVLLNIKEKNVIGFGDKMSNGKAVGFKVKDWVNHPVFGDGQVLSINGGLAEIMFGFQYGVRKILASHPSLTKLEVHDE